MNTNTHTHCHRVRPTVELAMDGISLNPVEVVFIEVNGGAVRNQFTSAVYARKYAEWQHRKVCDTCCIFCFCVVPTMSITP